MNKLKEFIKKYVNKKIMFGGYVAIILIILVIVMSNHYENSQQESMASEVKTNDPMAQIAQVPTERVGKEETRIETLDRLEKEKAAEIDKNKKDSLAKIEAQQAAEAKRFEQKLSYTARRTSSHSSASNRKERQADLPQNELTEFEKFKQELQRLDSLDKAGTETDNKKSIPEKPLKSEDKSFFVYKDGYQSSPYFNSIVDTEEPSHIKAMVDEVVKAKQSSRVRLRLLDDITVDGKVIPRNHYLYAHVTGFSGQRIMLTITSMLLKDKIYPVNLEIYDLDGYSGLHVPRSSFQEFMQDFNSNTASSTTVDVDDSNSTRLAQMGYDMLDNLISTTRRALQNKAKTNKAKVKYNTQVLLINANEKN